jgi:hypothetical protein
MTIKYLFLWLFLFAQASAVNSLYYNGNEVIGVKLAPQGKMYQLGKIPVPLPKECRTFYICCSADHGDDVDVFRFNVNDLVTDATYRVLERCGMFMLMAGIRRGIKNHIARGVMVS